MNDIKTLFFILITSSILLLSACSEGGRDSSPSKKAGDTYRSSESVFGELVATSKQINSSTGYKFDMPSIGGLRITKVELPGKPLHKCKVDVESLKKILKNENSIATAKKAKDEAIIIDLKANITIVSDGDGNETTEIVCSGKGTSCKVTITVPDDDVATDED